MKKALRVIGVLCVVAFIYSMVGRSESNNGSPQVTDERPVSTTVQNTPIPTLIPEWNSMTYEEQIDYFNSIKMPYVLEHDLHQETETSYSPEFYYLIKNTIRQEARDKYDIAFKRKKRGLRTRVDSYLLFDFDSNEFILLFQREYGRHYGKFIGDRDDDWTLLKNEDPFIDGETFRYMNNMLYLVYKDGTIDTNAEYSVCDIEEPLIYIDN